MILHIVMLNLLPDHNAGELRAVMDGLAGLNIDGFTAFRHGPNRDVENKTPDYPYGFICSFTDLAALGRYADDPHHKALGARLCQLCVDGANGVMVMDLEL